MKEDVILGTLLGDAWIQKAVRKNKIKADNINYGFSFQQSIEEFTRYKADLIGLPYTISEYHRFDKRTLKTYTIFNCYISMNKELKKEYYDLFYKPKKEVTIELLDKLTDLSVAVWYMDDGSLRYDKSGASLILCVNGFSIEGQFLIIDWFKEKYDITFRKNAKAIALYSKKDIIKFMDIIEQYDIPECMQYKRYSVAKEKYNNEMPYERKKFRNNKYKE